MYHSSCTSSGAAIVAIALITIFCNSRSLAQYQGDVYLEDSTVKVFDKNAQELPLAWAGGFNNPQFTMGDLNQDGLNDLVAFEKFTQKVKTFINRGTPGNPKYVYSPRYALNFPKSYDYLILADYNCDNVPDLFIRGQGGYAAYKGFYNTQHELCFTFYKELKYSNDLGVTPPNNAEVNPSDIPAIVDVDNDGDLDFISYSGQGSQLYFYKNVRAERNLPCDSIVITKRDKCWGRVNQMNARTHILGANCDNSQLVILPGEKTTDGGNSLTLFDADGDGDYDYLDGNIFYNDMVFLKNGRIQYGGIDSMVAQDTTWQGNAKVVSIPQWPVAYNIDYDCDGKKDIVVAPHAEDISENYKCIWYYKNTGTSTSPTFTYQKDTLLIDQSIEVGSAAFPMFYDYDKDGKPDLFVGDDGYYQTGGTFRSRLAYYRNTSTIGHPSFQLISKDSPAVFSNNFYGASPAFGDLDNDGKDDMVLGHNDGTLSFYKNNAASNSVQPVWQISQTILKNDNNVPINVLANAMPFVYDIDKDGKKDLVIGCGDVYLYYYKNTGTSNQLKLHLESTNLGNAASNFTKRSAPFIGKMDNVGKDYLVLGTDLGPIFRYSGFQSGNTTVPYILTDNNYAHIAAGNHVALTIADIDGDGKYEMVTGNELGGVNIYHQAFDVTDSFESIGVTTRNPLQLYPNPAENVLLIGVSGGKIADNAEAKIYNSMGQLITTARKGDNNATIRINIEGLAPGMYFCFMRNEDEIYTGSFIKK